MFTFVFIAATKLFRSSHSFLTISTSGPIRSRLFSPLFCIFCQGPLLWQGEGRLCPIIFFCPKGALTRPGNGRQESDDGTL